VEERGASGSSSTYPTSPAVLEVAPQKHDQREQRGRGADDHAHDRAQKAALLGHRQPEQADEHRPEGREVHEVRHEVEDEALCTVHGQQVDRRHRCARHGVREPAPPSWCSSHDSSTTTGPSTTNSDAGCGSRVADPFDGDRARAAAAARASTRRRPVMRMLVGAHRHRRVRGALRVGRQRAQERGRTRL
jgi:hypothetical protein